MANMYRNIFIRGLTEILNRAGAANVMTARRLKDDDRQVYARTRKTHQDLMREVTTYANFASTQEVYIHRARQNDTTAYNIAITDWLKAPRVLEIDIDAWTGEPGQTIQVKARDNVLVAGVTLVIRDRKENVLETGEAVQSEPGSPWWDYTTRSHITIEPFPSVEAIARDLPGNYGSFAIS